MISEKTIEALRIQIEGSERCGNLQGSYTGLRLAVLCLIQAHELSFEKARKVINKVDIYVSRAELLKWLREKK